MGSYIYVCNHTCTVHIPRMLPRRQEGRCLCMYMSIRVSLACVTRTRTAASQDLCKSNLSAKLFSRVFLSKICFIIPHISALFNRVQQNVIILFIKVTKIFFSSLLLPFPPPFLFFCFCFCQEIFLNYTF